MEEAKVSQQDYEQLKSTFLNPVLIGKDIFQKTQPKEFNEFQTFLEKTAPYDIVLDGLNVALRVHKSQKSYSVSSFLLKSTVKHFADQNKRVLVLGRKHMLKWPKHDMQYIFDNAHVFLAENISQDDPFLLYATLYSGLGTCFVSKDMMRGHKFLLADPKVQVTFQKWQAQHQYFIKYIENNGRVEMSEPVLFMQSIQQNTKGDWHIPYQVKEVLTTKTVVDNFHRHWLCLTNQPTHQALQGEGHRRPAKKSNKNHSSLIVNRSNKH